MECHGHVRVFLLPTEEHLKRQDVMGRSLKQQGIFTRYDWRQQHDPSDSESGKLHQSEPKCSLNFGVKAEG